MDAFRTAMSFRFFNWLTNNRIGFCLSQREFRLYLGLKIVQVPITIFFRSLVILQVILRLRSQLKQDLRSTAIYGAKIIIFKILPLYIVPLRKSYSHSG
jgi:hypothetical protein